MSASLDRDRIVQGETVTLVIQTNDPQQNLDPNLDGLLEDFVLLDRRSETQMSIVNGRQSAVMRLLITLEPKREGELQIAHPYRWPGQSQYAHLPREQCAGS